MIVKCSKAGENSHMTVGKEYETLYVEEKNFLNYKHPYLEPRAEYVDKIFTEFLEAAKASIDAMDKVFKQHQAVNEYYKEWRVSFQDMKEEAWLLRSSIQ